MTNKISRREFTKNICFLILSLPVISFLFSKLVNKSLKIEVKPHKAMHYKTLAG